jgi:pimeloyl-ACP methyl ester carboxylesterase
MWESAAEVIAKNAPSFDIILADLPGFGKAPLEKQWTLGAAMVDLHDQLSAQGVLEPVIGGLSMGGYAALAYYQLYQNQVKALILSNTKAAADTPEAKEGREEFAKDVETRGHESVYEKMLPKLVSESAKKRDADLIPKLKRWIELSTPQAIASGLRALALRDDSTDLLPTISCPTLLITGENDGIIASEEMEAMASQIKGSKFISFMKGGHLTAVEDPEKWGSVVSSFLNML